MKQNPYAKIGEIETCVFSEPKPEVSSEDESRLLAAKNVAYRLVGAKPDEDRFLMSKFLGVSVFLAKMPC